MAEIYPFMEKHTNFWFDYRDDNHNGLPQYHNGNDSGWDNATVFDVGFPMEGPDLSAFLVLQMDVLADLARHLGREDKAVEWSQRSDALLTELLAAFWVDGRFVFRNALTGAYTQGSRSLLPYIPLILGEKLPVAIREKLIAELSDPAGLVTTFGPASEHPDSSLYDPDGYWRGPIWAPSTFLIVEGLKAAGAPDLARSIALKFCALCEQSGFAENFDALTAAPLRDRAYTWTSSVYLYFLFEYAG